MAVQHRFEQIQASDTDKRGTCSKGDEEQHQEEDNYDDEQEELSGPRSARFQCGPKLLPLSPEDDIEQFLTTFERIVYVCHWSQDEWAVRLVPPRTG